MSNQQTARLAAEMFPTAHTDSRGGRTLRRANSAGGLEEQEGWAGKKCGPGKLSGRESARWGPWPCAGRFRPMEGASTREQEGRRQGLAPAPQAGPYFQPSDPHYLTLWDDLNAPPCRAVRLQRLGFTTQRAIVGEQLPARSLHLRLKNTLEGPICVLQRRTALVVVSMSTRMGRRPLNLAFLTSQLEVAEMSVRSLSVRTMANQCGNEVHSCHLS